MSKQTPPDDDGLDPVSALSLIAHEIRFEIVRELTTRSVLQWSEIEGVCYSELRRAVDIEDGGKFNYHLDQLEPTFVRKIDDQYVPTSRAVALFRAVRDGYFETTQPTVDAETGIDAPCEEHPLQVVGERTYVALRCPEHGVVRDVELPPSVIEECAPETIVEIALQDAFSYVKTAMTGRCPECWGDLSISAPVPFPSDATTDAVSNTDILNVKFDCDRCRQQFWLDASICSVTDRTTQSFLLDHGYAADEWIYLRGPLTPYQFDVTTVEDGARVELDEGDERLVATVFDGGEIEVTRTA